MNTAAENPVLAVEAASVRFRSSRRKYVSAVDDVSLELRKNEILGLIGESGSGKSTLARALLGLAPLSSGTVLWEGRPLSQFSKRQRRRMRTKVQMVFQDPHSALNPRRTVLRSVREPLDVAGLFEPAERGDKARAVLERVGLSDAHGSRYPHELSGGQKQRVNIARALIAEPSVLVCDESVASLDVALQAEILNLIRSLQEEFELSVLFISHDLAVVAHIADRIGVMYLGRLAEVTPTEAILRRPLHPYSEALISAQPRPVPSHLRTGERILLSGDIPSPVSPPSGCRFHTRCPYAEDLCAESRPALAEDEAGRYVACHRVDALELTGDPLAVRSDVVASEAARE